MNIKSKRIGEFGDNQLKGINLVIKRTAKRFKFIIGWELTNDWDKYPSILTINLIVDLEKAEEYYETEMSDYWLKRWKSDEFLDSYYILNLSKDKKVNSLEEHDKLEETINELYKNLSDDLSVFYEFESDGLKKDFKCDIKIIQYQNGPSQKMYYSI